MQLNPAISNSQRKRKPVRKVHLLKSEFKGNGFEFQSAGLSVSKIDQKEKSESITGRYCFDVPPNSQTQIQRNAGY